jgi:two-component system, cell cycle response regulator CpdR
MVRQFTILLAEDDSDVRNVVAQILLARNFDVLDAANGYDAIRLLMTRHVDVLLADIVMPGMSGYELVAQAKLMRPTLRILYTTGFDGDAPGREMASQHGRTLRKPIRANDLVNEIEKILPV